MVIVIPYTQADAPAALRMLHWMDELKAGKAFDCLLVRDIKVVVEQSNRVLELATQVFGKVWSVHTPFALPDEKWPIGANHMFETALRAMEPVGRPFLWMEPDCVLLQSEGLMMIDATYKQSAQPFMGQLIRTGKTDLPPIVMSGIAVYPKDACARLLKAVVQFKARQAFDIATAGVTVRECRQTSLIWNFYGEKGMPPTFAPLRMGSNGTPKPRNMMQWTDIPPRAVLFHRCKDGSLITVLREKMGMVKEVLVAAPAAPVQPASPVPAAAPAPFIQPDDLFHPRARRGPKQIHLGTSNLRGQVDGTAPVVKPPEGAQ